MYSASVYIRGVAVLVSALISLSANSDDLKKMVFSKEEFVAPGLGAEGIMLNEISSDVISRLRDYRYKIVKEKKDKELFRDILMVKGGKSICYTKLLYFERKKMFLFIYRNRVSAIAGLNRRKTVDGVSMNRGMEHFIYFYGNNNLSVIKQGTHLVYNYYNKGIMLIDDNGNDSIDMYIVYSRIR